MEINELINLEELFKKYNLDLERLQTLAKAVMFSPLIRKESIESIRKEYKSIRKIFPGDEQIMAELCFYDSHCGIIKNAYICNIPKEHSGEYIEVEINPISNLF